MAGKYDLVRISTSPRWYVAWSEGHRSRRISTGETDRRKAENFRAAFILEYERPAEAKPAEAGIVAVLDEYYERHARHRASHVQANIAVRRLTAFYGAAPVSAATRASQDDYVTKRRDAGAKDETISRELSVLRAALNRAVKYERLTTAPFVISLPKAPPRERALSRQEAAKLMRAAKSLHVRQFIRVALYTGARTSAVLDLSWDRVDFANRLIRFALPDVPESNKRRATVPMGGALLTALERGARRAQTDHVIEYHGAPVASVKTGFRQAAIAAGLVEQRKLASGKVVARAAVSPHALRRTAATWAAQDGVPMFAIGRMLGQSHASTTERYAKHHPDYLRGALQATLRGARNSRASQAGNSSGKK